jgi:hypothetical protein
VDEDEEKDPQTKRNPRPLPEGVHHRQNVIFIGSVADVKNVLLDMSVSWQAEQTDATYFVSYLPSSR